MLDLDQLREQLANIENHRSKLQEIIQSYNHIIILGNGGSNAISSHIAEDYTKLLKKNAVSFSDASLLTCYINDYGSGDAFRQFLESFADIFTLVILISSSGNSSNIVNSAIWCEDKGVSYIALSGFKSNNMLKTIAEKDNKTCELNFWVDSESYGIVECAHEIFLHSILEN